MLILLRLFFACLTAIGYKPMIYQDFTISSKQSDDLISEVDSKVKKNVASSPQGYYYFSNDFTSNDFAYYYFDNIKDFSSPSTTNLSYNAPYSSPIEYTYTSDNDAIGIMKVGGTGNNLFSGQSSYSINLSSSSNGRVTFTTPANTRAYNSIGLTNGNTTSGASWFVTGASGSNGYSYTFVKSTSYNRICFLVSGDHTDGYFYYDISNLVNGYTYRLSVVVSYSATNMSFYNITLSQGSTYIPYERFTNGVVQWEGTNAYRFTIKKELSSNPNYNTSCYLYTLSYYGRTPNDYPLLFTIYSYVMPNCKWEDNQGNLYNLGFYSYSYLVVSSDFNISNSSFVFQESSDTTIQPITTYYYNRFVEDKNSESYNIGYDGGFNEGYNEGRSTGYQSGYTDGYNNANNQDDTALTIFTGILEVGLLPVNVFLRFFEYEVFGINIAGLISGIVTVALIMILIRFIFGGKENG